MLNFFYLMKLTLENDFHVVCWRHMVPGQQEVTSGPKQTEWDVQSSPNSSVTSTQNQSDHLLLRSVLSEKGGGGEGEK